MVVNNPFSIQFGGMTFGGDSSTYQLIGPYVIDRGYESLRLVFDVLVVGTSIEELQELSAAIESRFSTRLDPSDTLSITMGSNTWEFAYGTDLLDPKSSITKSGNPDTDRAFSRVYTCVVDSQMPDSASGSGLRELEVIVTTNASRQKTLTMRGIYTSNEGGTAKANYDANVEALASSYTSAVDSSATWELVDESFTFDRERVSGDPKAHFVSFSRQYVELIFDQTTGQRDDETIRDHRVTFTDLSQYPGDSSEDGVDRLRRVVGSYDCAVDIDQSQNLKTVYRDKIRDHIKQIFESSFDPSEFGIEEERVSFDHTSNRVSVSIQFLYRTSTSLAIVEIQQSLAYRESRQIDYTPTHGEDEFAMEADVGFASLERIWSRTIKAVGDAPPTKRLAERASGAGVVGKWTDQLFEEAGPDSRDSSKVKAEGWNVVASTSQSTPVWIGAPNGDQIRITLLSEVVVERFHRKPSGGGGGGPITPGGGGGPITGQ